MVDALELFITELSFALVIIKIGIYASRNLYELPGDLSGRFRKRETLANHPFLADGIELEDSEGAAWLRAQR